MKRAEVHNKVRLVHVHDVILLCCCIVLSTCTNPKKVPASAKPTHWSPTRRTPAVGLRVSNYRLTANYQ